MLRPPHLVPFAALALAFVATAQQPGTTRLTFADTLKPIAWQSELPTLQWAADGIHLERTVGRERTWLDPRTGDSSPAGETPPPAARRTVRVFEGDLYLDDSATPPAGRGRGPATTARPGPGARQLTKDKGATGARELPQLAPDAASVSFVRGNDLCVLDVATATEWRITTDGGPERFHGKLDWVYQEEIYGRGSFQGHWWSPSGRHLAFLSLDESPVVDFPLTDHVPDGFLDRDRGVTLEVANYPKAGDPNPLATFSIARPGDHHVVPVDLSGYPKDLLVMRVDWTPDGKTLLLALADRIQTWIELVGVDPDTGAVTKWLREQGSFWTPRTDPPHFLPDGSFLWRSERTGYAHVYHLAAGGKPLAAVTSGEWQVRSIVRVDAARGLLWFEGTKDGATGRHLYRIGLDGQGLVCLTPGQGTHTFELSPDGALVLDSFSSLDHPTTQRVLDGTTGALVRELGQATRGDAAKYASTDRQRLTIRARDGYELDATVQLPLDWKKDGHYPVFLPTYSGPNAPTVRDVWAPSSYHVFLAQQGFLILQVNVRSASGRGLQHTGTCYQHLGAHELQDLEDAVDFVCREFAGDPQRVAISGWSYGGFMTAYALTHSTKFALGLAGAGVYDWRLYDSVYTERYMRTPQENAAGYDGSSVIKAAKQLHGHLVLLHGTMDDNVHLQNTMQLLWELQKAGLQDFELMVYPRSRHGLAREVNAHSLEFQWLRLQKLLGVGK